jgi:hypothetical protein
MKKYITTNISRSIIHSEAELPWGWPCAWAWRIRKRDFISNVF